MSSLSIFYRKTLVGDNIYENFWHYIILYEILWISNEKNIVFSNESLILFTISYTFYNYLLKSAAATTNAEKIFRLFSSEWKENSGCHCTAQTKDLFGMYTASTNPSSLRAISTSPGARLLIAWWWQLLTPSSVFSSRVDKGVIGYICTVWAARS